MAHDRRFLRLFVWTVVWSIVGSIRLIISIGIHALFVFFVMLIILVSKLSRTIVATVDSAAIFQINHAFPLPLFVAMFISFHVQFSHDFTFILCSFIVRYPPNFRDSRHCRWAPPKQLQICFRFVQDWWHFNRSSWRFPRECWGHEDYPIIWWCLCQELQGYRLASFLERYHISWWPTILSHRFRLHSSWWSYRSCFDIDRLVPRSRHHCQDTHDICIHQDRLRIKDQHWQEVSSKRCQRSRISNSLWFCQR